MERKVKFFRNVVANLTLAAVILCVMVFSLVDNILPSSEEEKPVFKGSSQTSVSLIVNVYQGSEYLEEMLNIFEDNSIFTTFFVSGVWAAENNSLLRDIYERGHEIGNHGYFHKDHQQLSAAANKEEISITHQLVKNIIGIDMSLFSPPFGSYSVTTLESVREIGYTTIMYTTDTQDISEQNTQLIYSRAVNNVSGGDFILIHPTKATVSVLSEMIKQIKANGYNITTVSEVLK